MKLASLDAVKFKKITRNNLVALKGGGATGAGQFFSHYEAVTKEVDGQTVHGTRAVYTTYGSDDIGQGYECYYDTGTSYGPPRWNW